MKTLLCDLRALAAALVLELTFATVVVMNTDHGPSRRLIIMCGMNLYKRENELVIELFRINFRTATLIDHNSSACRNCLHLRLSIS